MRLRYIYSACTLTETNDLKILSDPWFTQGIYEGSWYQYPQIKDPIKVIGPVDIIYISHIHPDHYDPLFLKEYLRQYPNTRLIIGHTEPPYLLQKMRIDGFKPEVVDSETIGDTTFTIIPNKARAVNIDTAMVICNGSKSIVNLNDNVIDNKQLEKIKALCPGGRPDFAMLPYAGATSHPQCFDFPSRADLDQAIQIKQEHFINTFLSYIQELNPRKVLPFAGKYWLAGPLSALNADRGIPDAVLAAKRANERFGEGTAIVLEDGGQAFIDLNTGEIGPQRLEEYSHEEINSVLTNSFIGYDYEREIQPLSGHNFPLIPLLNASIRKAHQRMPIKESYWLCIKPRKLNKYLCFDVAKPDDCLVKSASVEDVCAELGPRCEITIDDRYLFGLLSRFYHWNNAMIGSHYRCRRFPDVFRRDAFDYVDLLHV